MGVYKSSNQVSRGIKVVLVILGLIVFYCGIAFYNLTTKSFLFFNSILLVFKIYLYYLGYRFLEVQIKHVIKTMPNLSRQLEQRLLFSLEKNRSFAIDMSVLSFGVVLLIGLRTYFRIINGLYIDVLLDFLLFVSSTYLYLISDLGIIVFFTKDVQRAMRA